MSDCIKYCWDKILCVQVRHPWPLFYFNIHYQALVTLPIVNNQLQQFQHISFENVCCLVANVFVCCALFSTRRKTFRHKKKHNAIRMPNIHGSWMFYVSIKRVANENKRWFYFAWKMNILVFYTLLNRKFVGIICGLTVNQQFFIGLISLLDRLDSKCTARHNRCPGWLCCHSVRFYTCYTISL